MRTMTNTQEIDKPKYNKWTCYNREEVITHINKKHSIFAYGIVGTGKTHMLYYLANKYNMMNRQVFVIKSDKIHIQLIEDMQYNKATGEMRTSITTKMRDAELLFWDDIGNEKMTDFLHENYSNVIDYRYRNGLPTFITSNYTLAELYRLWKESIGEVKSKQLIDRIRTFGEIEIKSQLWRDNE